MCAGPHVPSAGKIGAFKMMKLAGAVLAWRRKPRAAAASLRHGLLQESSTSTCTMLEEAEKRDHRKIGREMDLFMMRDEAPASRSSCPTA